MDTKKKGNLTELQFLAAFMENECGVSIPYGDNSKYDFIADVNGKLLKIQVKTSSYVDEKQTAIKFSCRSTHLNCKGVSNVKYSKDEIDYFATYWENKCYLIPVEECSTQKNLRLTDTTKSGQVKGISFAKDYELSLQLQKIKEEVN